MLQTLFKRKSLSGLSPMEMTISYTALGLWTIVVLFPIYWLFTTSFKLPIDVNTGPLYLPFVDFKPSLHAWDYKTKFHQHGNRRSDQCRIRFVIGNWSSLWFDALSLSPTSRGSPNLHWLSGSGHLCHYAGCSVADGSCRQRCRVPHLIEHHRSSLQTIFGQQGYRLLVDLPAYVTSRGSGDPDLYFVPALKSSGHSHCSGDHLRGHEPAHRSLADARLLPDHPA